MFEYMDDRLQTMAYLLLQLGLLLFPFRIILISAFDNVDPSKTIVWGPGLKPDEVTMRARYFFVQLVEFNNQNVTGRLEREIVHAEIVGENGNGNKCRIWTQTLDCKDGSFIIRYRVYETCYKFHIRVKVKNQSIANGSLYSNGPVLEEECYCPKLSAETWLKEYGCSSTYSQIGNDLRPFPRVDFDSIRTKLIQQYNKPNAVSICHYVVKNNRIFRRCYGQHVGFKIFSDSILLSLARKVILPDVEFFMNLGDWPLVPKTKPLYPIFSWCGSRDTSDIVLPTYDITESSLENMGRVMLDMLSVQGNTRTPWDKKIGKMFWRGRDSRRERLNLINIAKKYPDLFNASITNFFFFKDEMNKYGPSQPHVSFFDFFQYKYQLNIDGTVAAYRLPYLLAGDALVFKQDSEYYEHFYEHLVPYEHFIPIKRDLSDIVEKLSWAMNNDGEALKMAKAGRELMRQVALPQDIFCYHVSLLQEWKRRISSNVEVLDGMEEVAQPDHPCPCQIEQAKSNFDGINAKDEF